jgi:hypothetical protein
MRWQESVSDEFVRPMHSVLSFPPGLEAYLPVRHSVYSRLAGRQGSPDGRYGITDSRVRFHGKPSGVGLVWAGQYDDRVRSLRWADAVTLARASEALEHSHQRQGCVASG